jgi:hypothetical protein
MAIRRRHFFELEDQPWFPRSLRELLTDFLRTASDIVVPYDQLVPLVQRGLEPMEERRIVDLCAGAGGAPDVLQGKLAKVGVDVEILATDLYPNVTAFERLGVPHVSTPVDATAVPDELRGMRTVFNALHHFRPELVRAIFADAADKKQSFLGVEIVERTPLHTGFMLGLPAVVLALTPFIRPFRWDRLLWTYLLPVAPLATSFDGIMSCLRAYTDDELRELTAGLDDGYEWEVGRLRIPYSPAHVTWILGRPA